MNEPSPLGTVIRIQPKHDYLSENEKMDICAKQGTALPDVELSIVTDEGTLAPTDGKTMGTLQIRGRGP
jgi:fatty-acyl-CoA synthase